MLFLRLLLVGFFCLGASNAFAMGKVEAPMYGQDPLVGKAAPDFTLPKTDGSLASVMSTRAGGKAILIFWATWCPHCREELAHVNENLAAIKAQGIKVILVSEGEDKDQVSEYLMKNNIGLESFLDEETALQEPYNIIGVPTVVFIDAQGKILNVDHELPTNYATIFENK